MALLIPACGGPGGGPDSSNAGADGATRLDLRPDDLPPIVVLTSPTNGAVFVQGASVELLADAADPDGAVLRVDFYQGTTLIASAAAPEFRVAWVAAFPGTFSLSALAFDNDGAATWSHPVTVTVVGPEGPALPANRPPSVAMVLPAEAATFPSGEEILLEADATDPEDGTPAVEFFDGTVSLGRATSRPPQVTWAGAPTGPHSLRAVAVDSNGAMTVSVPVAISVAAAPVPETPLPPAASLRDVFFATPSRGWAVGDQGTILFTSDGGDTWAAQASGTLSTLTRVQFLSENLGWVVGSEGTILRTVDGGATWVRQDSRTGQSLLGLSFGTPAVGWVVGVGGTILRTTNGGTTWTTQASGTVGDLSAVGFFGTMKGWAGGSGELLRTVNSGASWIRDEAVLQAEPMRFFDAAIQSESRGTMVGSGAGGGLLRTTFDGGQTWTAVILDGAGSAFRSVAAGDAGHLWAVGTSGSIAASVDGGATWFKQGSPTSRPLFGVSAVSSTRAWAVGEGGVILRTDNGQTWTRTN